MNALTPGRRLREGKTWQLLIVDPFNFTNSSRAGRAADVDCRMDNARRPECRVAFVFSRPTAKLCKKPANAPLAPS